jgi:hypothetical protein
VTTCLPSTSLVLADVEFHFRGMTVAQFAADVAFELGLAKDAVRVKSSAGIRQSGSTRMDYLASLPDGFLVDVMNAPSVRFSRRRAM